MPPNNGSYDNKPNEINPYKTISYKITDEELPKLVAEFQAMGRPIKYNKSGQVNRTQFNNYVRDKRLKELKIQNMPQEQVIEEMGIKLSGASISDEQMAEIGRKLQAGEISMEEGKKVLLYKYKDDPAYMCVRLFKHITLDRVTNTTTPAPAFHKELFQLFLNHNKLAIASPRGHGKTTVTSFFWILHQALFQKKKFIVLISATEDLAIRFLRDIKAELETNRELIWLFGYQKNPDKWSEHEITLMNGCRIIAKGRGGQMRGLKDRGTRPDLIVLDDLEDSEMVRSEIRRLDLEEWFNGDVLPTLEPSIGQIIFIGTILHMDALLNRVLDKDLYPDFLAKRYSAIMDVSGIRTPLWPERFPLELLDQIKQSYISRGQLATFFMEYMNDPVPDEGATFTQDMIQFYETLPNDPFENDIIKELFIDLGGGGLKKTADPTAMVVFCTDRKTGNMYVEDYISKRLGTDTDAIIRHIRDLVSLHSVRRIYIEKTIATNLLVSSLDRAIRSSHLPPIEYVAPTRGTADRRGMMSDGKFQRIAQMEAPIRIGQIKFKKWMTEMIEQLMMFPRGQHDDLIDALSYGFMFAKKKKKETQGKQFRPATRHGYLNRNYAT